jgi:hypothetical protein
MATFHHGSLGYRRESRCEDSSFVDNADRPADDFDGLGEGLQGSAHR